MTSSIVCLTDMRRKLSFYIDLLSRVLTRIQTMWKQWFSIIGRAETASRHSTSLHPQSRDSASRWSNICFRYAPVPYPAWKLLLTISSSQTLTPKPKFKKLSLLPPANEPQSWLHIDSRAFKTQIGYWYLIMGRSSRRVGTKTWWEEVESMNRWSEHKI